MRCCPFLYGIDPLLSRYLYCVSPLVISFALFYSVRDPLPVNVHTFLVSYRPLNMRFIYGNFAVHPAVVRSWFNTHRTSTDATWHLQDKDRTTSEQNVHLAYKNVQQPYNQRTHLSGSVRSKFCACTKISTGLNGHRRMSTDMKRIHRICNRRETHVNGYERMPNFALR